MEPKHTLLKVIYRPARSFFSDRTLHLLWFDLLRSAARLKRWRDKNIVPQYHKLHLGCGHRRIAGWLNVDVTQSDYDVDLAQGTLPWADGVFEAIVSQHVIEHLELRQELLPLLWELNRILKPGGEIWLSCPDIEKVCRSYLDQGMVDLLADREKRDPNYSLAPIPSYHLINDLFHQFGYHKNLFDFHILEWALTEAGFTAVQRVSEHDLLARFTAFPPRNDELQSIYVSARKPTTLS